MQTFIVIAQKQSKHSVPDFAQESLQRTPNLCPGQTIEYYKQKKNSLTLKISHASSDLNVYMRSYTEIICETCAPGKK